MADDKNIKDTLDDSEDGLPKWGDLLKKVMGVGLGAAFMTEESIRAILGEVKMPKEVLHMILQGANKSKDDLMNRVGNETIRLIQKIGDGNRPHVFHEVNPIDDLDEAGVASPLPENCPRWFQSASNGLFARR